MLQAKVLTRVFFYNGVRLPDPGINQTPEQVRDVYSAAYSELSMADILPPVTTDGTLTYTFQVSAGGKG